MGCVVERTMDSPGETYRLRKENILLRMTIMTMTVNIDKMTEGLAKMRQSLFDKLIQIENEASKIDEENPPAN